MRIRKIVAFSAVVILTLSLAALLGQQPRPSPKSPAFPKPPPSARVWISQTTGREYRVWTDNDRLFAEWVSIPPALAQRGAYTRSECQRTGTRWIGTSQVYRPCDTMEQGKRVTNWCHLTTKIEFDKVGADRITGRGEGLRRFDCASCKILETVWVDFEWVPKEAAPLPAKK